MVTAANPQSLPAYRFVGSLNEMNNIHERRLTALRNHVPVAVMFMLTGTAMVAMGFTGFNAGVVGARRHLTTFIMAVTVALLIMLIVDLDRPYRGLIQVPVAGSGGHGAEPPTVTAGAPDAAPAVPSVGYCPSCSLSSRRPAP